MLALGGSPVQRMGQLTHWSSHVFWAGSLSVPTCSSDSIHAIEREWVVSMSSIIVRSFDESVKNRLAAQAKEHGRSMEAEVARDAGGFEGL